VNACAHEWVRAGEREASVWLCLQCGVQSERDPRVTALTSNERTLGEDLAEAHRASGEREFVNHITPIVVRHAQELFQTGYRAGLLAERARHAAETTTVHNEKLERYAAALISIATSEDETDEWDAVTKYEEVRKIASMAITPPEQVKTSREPGYLGDINGPGLDPDVP